MNLRNVGILLQHYTASHHRRPLLEVPNLFINFAMQEYVLFDKFFDTVKFTSPTPLSLLISCKFSFPSVVLKNIFSPFFALQTPKFSCGASGTLWFLRKIYPLHH